MKNQTGMKDNTALLQTAIEQITQLREQYKSLRDSSLLPDNFEYFEYKRSGVQASLNVLEQLLSERVTEVEPVTQPTINQYNEAGERHGLWERYYDTDQLEYKGYYVNGKEHGYWEEYWDNGQLCYKGDYVDGKQHGYFESYHYNGQLEYKGNYVNGKEHGYWEYYHYNGKLWYKGYYDMGNKVDYNPDEKVELTLEEIADKLNIPVSQLRIKD